VRIPDHPLVNEVISDCLHEAMDIDGLKDLLRAIREGAIRTVAIDTAEPSKFSHEILNANPFAFLDDAPLEERRARAVQLRNTLRTDVVDRVDGLNIDVIREVEAESWPVVRSADELHDAILTLIELPAEPQWQAYFDELVAAGRAGLHVIDGREFWVPTEKVDLFNTAHGTQCGPEMQSHEMQSRPLEAGADEITVTEIVRGWMESIGPVTAAALAQRLALPVAAIDAALLRLETEGQVLRGNFTPALESAGPHGEGDRPVEWCNRRVLARIHRRMLATLRREIEPVSTARYERFLEQWQHLAPGSQLHGVEGTLRIVKQLQGLEFPASSWESEILRKRVAHYDPKWLDDLCASGDVMWGRLTPHPAFEPSEQPRGRRVRPTRVAPISLFLRQDADWLITRQYKGSGRTQATERGALSAPARDVLEAIEQHGASFFVDLVRATNRLASEVEDGLWELVAAGLVTADGFDNLRALIDPKRRLALGRHNLSRPRHAIGRWALLKAADVPRSANAHDAENEAFAHQLLARWGVVFRDVVRRESFAPPWRDLLITLRRLEMQGVVRGGRFIASSIGEQFCRPDALEALRAMREPATAAGSALSRPA
ncbi:MAG TPA: hypothetical protein VIX35_03055, partial [Vicinamibacterales bacterium]